MLNVAPPSTACRCPLLLTRVSINITRNGTTCQIMSCRISLVRCVVWLWLTYSTRNMINNQNDNVATHRYESARFMLFLYSLLSLPNRILGIVPHQKTPWPLPSLHEAFIPCPKRSGKITWKYHEDAINKLCIANACIHVAQHPRRRICDVGWVLPCFIICFPNTWPASRRDRPRL